MIVVQRGEMDGQLGHDVTRPLAGVGDGRSLQIQNPRKIIDPLGRNSVLSSPLYSG